MNNFERITASPEALGAFLASLHILQGPWDDAFHFGRHLLATELEAAAATIEDMAAKLEAAANE